MKNNYLFLVFILLLVSSNANAEASLKKLKLFNDFNGPGIAVLKIKDGKIIHQEGYGLANIHKKLKIDNKTNFNIASNSKQFTAYGIYLLQKQGKLSFKDKVSKFIPELPLYAKEVEIEDLLYHTSGLPDYMEICGSQNNIKNSDVLKLLKDKKSLEFNAGTAFEYSNTGYVLLSEIISRVAKKTFPRFIQEEIFRKLKMENTYVLRSDGKDSIKNQAISYGPWPFFQPQGKVVCDTVYGDGGVVTNLVDYAKWLNFISSQEDLFKSGELKSGDPTQYALGWGLGDHQGNKIIFHSGSWNDFKSFTLYLPHKKTWVAMFANYYQAPLSDLSKEMALE